MVQQGASCQGVVSSGEGAMRCNDKHRIDRGWSSPNHVRACQMTSEHRRQAFCVAAPCLIQPGQGLSLLSVHPSALCLYASHNQQGILSRVHSAAVAFWPKRSEQLAAAYEAARLPLLTSVFSRHFARLRQSASFMPKSDRSYSMPTFFRL